MKNIMNDITVKRGLWQVSFLISILLWMSLGMVIPTSVANATNVTVTVEWEVFFGGPDDDSALACIQTADGGYAALVTTEESQTSLVKFTANGQQEWNTTFWYVDGAGWTQKMEKLVQTPDGGYVISDRFGAWGNMNQFLHKRNATGYHEWNSTFGGGWANSIILAEDGGFVLTGGTDNIDNHDVWLVKTDSQGLPEWNRTFGGEGLEIAGTIIHTSDGGYAIAGSSILGLLKTDANGTEEWHTGPHPPYFHRIIQLADGSYVLGGELEEDFWLLKATSTGEYLWNVTYGGPWWSRDVMQSLIQTADGGYLLAGDSYYQSSLHYNMWLVKTDAAGQQEWNTTLGDSDHDRLTSVVQMSDGSFVIAGTTQPPGKTDTDMWLLKVKVAEGTTTTTTTKPSPGFEWIVLFFTLSFLWILSCKRRH